MAASNLARVRRMAPDREAADRTVLFLSFDPARAGNGGDLEVPDPYNGGPEEYALVFDLVQPAARGLADQLAELLADRPAPAGGAAAGTRPAKAGRRAGPPGGGALARLHAAGGGTCGAPWPGWIAGLPLPNDAGDSWPEWYGTQRLLPYARRARDAGSLTSADVRLIETVAARAPDLAGPAEPPSRIHGDCWSGNVLWSGGRGWLIDPAAQGGHRETDLAMLALFGAPFLARSLACYEEVAPRAAGWRERVPLHQLHPLLVHVCLFGTAYRASALDTARTALSRMA